MIEKGSKLGRTKPEYVNAVAPRYNEPSYNAGRPRYQGPKGV